MSKPNLSGLRINHWSDFLMVISQEGPILNELRARFKNNSAFSEVGYNNYYMVVENNLTGIKVMVDLLPYFSGQYDHRFAQGADDILIHIQTCQALSEQHVADNDLGMMPDEIKYPFFHNLNPSIVEMDHSRIESLQTDNQIRFGTSYQQLLDFPVFLVLLFAIGRVLRCTNNFYTAGDHNEDLTDNDSDDDLSNFTDDVDSEIYELLAAGEEDFIDDESDEELELIWNENTKEGFSQHFDELFSTIIPMMINKHSDRVFQTEMNIFRSNLREISQDFFMKPINEVNRQTINEFKASVNNEIGRVEEAFKNQPTYLLILRSLKQFCLDIFAGLTRLFSSDASRNYSGTFFNKVQTPATRAWNEERSGIDNLLLGDDEDIGLFNRMDNIIL